MSVSSLVMLLSLAAREEKLVHCLCKILAQFSSAISVDL